VHLVPRSSSCLRPWLDQLSPSYAPEFHFCNVHVTCDVHYVSIIQFLGHPICSLVLNPVRFTLSTCSTLSTLVSPLIELSSKHQNSQESFHLPKRRPDAATWPAACDVSQRAEPDVRPLGYAAPAFIADKAHRLSIPLTSDVQPRHSMRHVHSAGGMLVHSAGRQHSHTTVCIVLIITRTLPRKLPLHINTTRAADIRAPGDCTDVTCISYFRYSFHYVPRPTCRASASLYVPPLSYKREDTQRYKAGSQNP
jgi:hypothetical protein